MFMVIGLLSQLREHEKRLVICEATPPRDNIKTVSLSIATAKEQWTEKKSSQTSKKVSKKQ